MKKLLSTLLFSAILLMTHLGMASIPDQKSDAEFFVLDTLEADRPQMLPCVGEITSEYGPRRMGRRRVKLHKGIDIAAPVGTPILAPADGTVVFVGRKSGYGKTVVLEHGENLTTLFAHNSKILVEEGQTVTRGQEISLVGNTGRSTGPHLHYEVRIDDAPVDPSEFI